MSGEGWGNRGEVPSSYNGLKGDDDDDGYVDDDNDKYFPYSHSPLAPPKKKPCIIHSS